MAEKFDYKKLQSSSLVTDLCHNPSIGCISSLNTIWYFQNYHYYPLNVSIILQFIKEMCCIDYYSTVQLRVFGEH